MAVKVLILEDNPVARSFLCRVVRESFSDLIAITEASDLESARRQLAASGGTQGAAGGEPYQLILVDLELPDGKGLEVLAMLPQQGSIKIATTLYSDDEHLFPALQCGADGYLLKEDRFEVLVEELQKIVRGQPPLSPAIARRLLSHFRDAAASDGVARDSGQMSLALARGGEPSASHGPIEPARLSMRESEVLSYLSKGFTVKEIASLAGIKWFAVNEHIKSIYRKLNASSRSAAVLPSSQHDLA